MTATQNMPPLHEMYSQDEIDRATEYVNRVYKVGPDDLEENPVAGWADFAEGVDSTELIIEAAIRAVLARRWYAVNGPQDPDLQPLPLGWSERQDLPRYGAKHILYWFARSLAHLDYDIFHHPSFYDYACGTLAHENEGSQLLEELRDHFPPRFLPGLDRITGDWDPPTKERAAKRRSRRSR